MGCHCLLHLIEQVSTNYELVIIHAYTQFINIVMCSPEKAMAPHSSTLAWKIPWMEEPGRLQSMGSPRVGHDFTFTFYFHALEKTLMLGGIGGQEEKGTTEDEMAGWHH